MSRNVSLMEIERKKCREDDSKRSKRSLPTLLRDVIYNVLSKLPIKSFLRCKVVSKNCYQLAKDAHFTNILLNNNGSPQQHTFILFDKNSFKLYLIGSAVTEISHQLRDKAMEIITSCNGLLCCLLKPYYDYLRIIMIYNPITRENTILPELNGWNIGNRIFFGFDEKNNQHKVLAIDRSGDGTYTGYVINVGESFWRTLDLPFEIDSFVRCGEESVFCNGAFYWTTRKDFNDHILCMDICHEKFTIIEFPNFGNGVGGHVPRKILCSYRMRLAMVTYISCKNSFQIWLLTDNKDGKWILESTHSMYFSDRRFIRFDGIAGNQSVLKLLLRYSTFDDPSNKQLVLFSIEEGNHSIDTVSGLSQIPKSYQVCPFVASMVSMHG